MLDRELTIAVVEAAEAFCALRPTQVTPGAAARLEELAARLANLRAYQAGAMEADSVPVRSRPCEQCATPIFFALGLDGRWMPLEVDTIDAEEVTPGFRWVVDFDGVGPGRPPTVRFQPTAVGPVYVDHRHTCGTGPGPRKFKTKGLTRRWKVNVERADHIVESSSEAMRRELMDRLRRSEARTRDHER